MNVRQKKKKHSRDLELLWARIGYLIHLAQMIEYNLLNILAGHKYIESIDGLSIYDFDNYDLAAKKSNDVLATNKKKELGVLLRQAKNDSIFSGEFVTTLEKVVDRRNYCVHHFFKDQLKNNTLEINPLIHAKEIGETIALFFSVNEALLDIDIKYRKLAKQMC